MTAKTPKTRISRKARLHQFPVLGLFRPVLAGKPGAPTGAGVRAFPVCFLELTERSQAPGCAGCPVSSLLFTGIGPGTFIDFPAFSRTFVHVCSCSVTLICGTS